MSVYTGENVTLQIVDGNFHIVMRAEAITDTLVLTSIQGAQLMTFLMESFGLSIVQDEEDDEDREGSTLQ